MASRPSRRRRSGHVRCGRAAVHGRARTQSRRSAEHATDLVAGVAVERSGDLVVGALVAVNALGDVIDADGAVLAGCTAEAGAARYPYDAVEAIPGFTGRGDADADELARSNTTIGCLVTNARLTKPEACRAVDLAHTGIARAIEPPHTNFDGDALFLLATGEVDTQPDLVATLGAAAVARAIRSEFAS
ncbi:MAG: P1 family peptidase [Acidimicrobiaceae bacterium]|nr:P1 family peptidase [Acidimicrobiaceae bacterium]MDE0497002.1 P1 family peptidase [Acidimicrobiaceae bacterium]